LTCSNRGIAGQPLAVAAPSTTRELNAYDRGAHSRRSEMALKLKFGHSPNPRLQPLADGTVKVEGAELEWEFMHPGRLFHKQLVEDCYDVFEFSIADYFVVQTRREQFARLQWQALPVFMSKPIGLLINFHAHESAKVRTFADLGGKSLGVPDYGMTAARR